MHALHLDSSPIPFYPPLTPRRDLSLVRMSGSRIADTELLLFPHQTVLSVHLSSVSVPFLDRLVALVF